jgi:hypothetical protein
MENECSPHRSTHQRFLGYSMCERMSNLRCVTYDEQTQEKDRVIESQERFLDQKGLFLEFRAPKGSLFLANAWITPNFQLYLLSILYSLREGWQRGSRLVYSQTDFGSRSDSYNNTAREYK